MTKRNLKYGQVVSFEWNDATTFIGWHGIDGAASKTIVNSTAIVVESHKYGLVITTSVNKEVKEVCDPLTIPWDAIRTLKVINAKPI